MINSNIGIIGLGRMGRCLVEGLKGKKGVNSSLFFTRKNWDAAEEQARELGITALKSNIELVQKCKTVVLAVKPQSTMEIFSELQDQISDDCTVISIVASSTIKNLAHGLGKTAQSGKEVRIVRAMPNTPAFVKQGITAVCFSEETEEQDWQRVEKLFSPLGELVQVAEQHMDAITGLSGCGPAYIYVVLESLTEGGIKVGLPRDLSSKLAAHTVMGAAKMLLETKKHPAELKDEVTTPAGCTIDGLMELEEGKLRVTLIKAIVQATKRARTLGKKWDSSSVSFSKAKIFSSRQKKKIIVA